MRHSLERHLVIEERIGFIEAVLGHLDARTVAMRAHQRHIRQLAQRLDDAVSTRNAPSLAIQADALLLAMHLQEA